jgi:hypothetical protein
MSQNRYRRRRIARKTTRAVTRITEMAFMFSRRLDLLRWLLMDVSQLTRCGRGGGSIARRGRSGNDNFIRNAQQNAEFVYNLGRGDISDLGVVLFLTLIGVVVALSPGYLGLPPASIPSDLVLSLAGSLWIWSTVGLFVYLGEIRKFISGFNEEGWENLLIAVVFLAPAAALYGGVQILELPAWIELVCKLISIVLAVLGAMFVAATLDSFFIKPRLRNLVQPKPKGRAGRGSQLGGVATAIAWVLSNIANLLVILDQLVPKG